MKLKLKMSMKTLVAINKCLISVIIRISQKNCDNSNKLVIGKMEDETGGVAIEEIVGMKPKMYSFLVDISEYKKTKGAKRNVVATISHNEYKDVLWNNKCIRHSMNRIQSKDHKIETYEISKISLPCFDDKIYIESNGNDGLALGYQS